MALADETKRLRIRDSELIDSTTRLQPHNRSGAPTLVARTTTLVKYPTTAGGFYACNPVTVLGPESEGSAGVITTSSAVFFALNLGSAIPPTGTQILATFIGNRWVFRYDG